MIDSEIKTIQLDGIRFYHTGDHYYPSVTSILSIKPNPALEKWKKSLTPAQVKAILDYTSVRGEIIHYLALQHYETEKISQGDSPDEAIEIANENDQMLKEIWKAIDLFHNFQSRYTLEAKYLEKAVWNSEYNYAGRVDYVGFLTDSETGFKRPIIMDIKTSKQIYEESVSLQLSAYNKALKNWGTELWVLLLHPGSSKVDGITIGADKPFYEFKQVNNSFPDFTYYEAKFRDKAQATLKTHGLL